MLPSYPTSGTGLAVSVGPLVRVFLYFVRALASFKFGRKYVTPTGPDSDVFPKGPLNTKKAILGSLLNLIQEAALQDHIYLYNSRSPTISHPPHSST